MRVLFTGEERPFPASWVEWGCCLSDGAREVAAGPGWGLHLVRKPEQGLEPLASLTHSFPASVPQARRLPGPALSLSACQTPGIKALW